MVEEAYCSYEVSKLLKEKGFNEPIRCWYDNFQDFHEEGVRMSNTDCLPPTIMCPTHQMAMAWLREVYNLCLFVIPATIDETFRTGRALYPLCDDKWEWCASKNDRSKATFGCDINSRYCNSYEEAVEAAVKYCLENLI